MFLSLEVWKQLRDVITKLISIRELFINANADEILGKSLDSKMIRKTEAIARNFQEITMILELYNSEKSNFDLVNSFLHLKITDEEFGEVIDKLESNKVKLNYVKLQELDIAVKYYNYLVEHSHKHLGHIKLL